MKEGPTATAVAGLHPQGEALFKDTTVEASMDPDPVRVDLILWGKRPLRVSMPLSEARKNIGLAGYYVRQIPPLRQMFGVGLGLFFAVFLGFYAFLFYMAWPPVILWGLVGMAMGAAGGWFLGMVMTFRAMGSAYIAWTSWDPTKKSRTITPVGHSAANIKMEPKHRRAFLAAIGEAPPPTKKPAPGADGQGFFGSASGRASVNGSAEEDEDPMTAHIVATYSTKALYSSLQAKIQKRLLVGTRKGEKMVQYVSIGSIAVALMVVAAVVTLTMTGDRPDAPAPKPQATVTSPGSGASNAKR